jgi:hypothetical protein
LNTTLRLREPLKDLSRGGKRNDIFAVQLFTVENMLQLLRAGDVDGGYDLTPFVTWYAAISTPDLHGSLRIDLLTISFTVFRDWFRIAHTERNSIRCGKFFTERVDLVRYLNTILFLRLALENFPEIALNQLGTHPVENLLA